MPSGIPVPRFQVVPKHSLKRKPQYRTKWRELFEAAEDMGDDESLRVDCGKTSLKRIEGSLRNAVNKYNERAGKPYRLRIEKIDISTLAIRREQRAPAPPPAPQPEQPTQNPNPQGDVQ